MINKTRKSLLCVFVLSFILSIVGVFAVQYNKTFADEPTYGEITTSVVADSTLQYIAGRENTDTSDGQPYLREINKETTNMPKENDGSTVSSGYRIYVHPFYTSVGKEAIKFANPISAEDMLKSGGLTIRMYCDLSPNFIPIVTIDGDLSYGIYIYGLGATGGYEDHPVWIPADIEQRKYVDFKINAYDASRLADSEGNITGLVFASYINRDGARLDESYFNTTANIYIKSISWNAPDTTPATKGELDIYMGMGGLTHVNGQKRRGDTTSYTNYSSSFAPVDVVPGYRTDAVLTELPKDNGETVEKAYRFTYRHSGTVVAKNSILFEKPLTIADIESSDGLNLRLYAHLTSDGADYKRYNDTYGFYFYGYGKGITGESDDKGVLIPVNIPKDEWCDLHIDAETLKLMAGDDGILYGLDYGARIDVVTDTTMYLGNVATNQGHILLSKVTLLEKDKTALSTKLVDDNTLQYVYGLLPELSNGAGNSNKSYSSIELKSTDIPLENNLSIVTSAYRVPIHPFYAQVTNNAIAFETPLTVQEIEKSGGLVLRMYAKLSDSDRFFVQGHVSDYAYGIYIYGLGATGRYDDHPIWVPADITQNEWIDFKINAYDAALLADSEGELKGLTFASNIKVNNVGSKPEYFYVTNPSPCLYISGISIAEPEMESIVYGELATRTGMGNLTHVLGSEKTNVAGETKYGNEYHAYQHKMLPIDIAPGPRSYSALSELPKDNGQTVDKAYRLSLHSGAVAVSKHSILFDRPLTVSDIQSSGGINLRIYAHLTEGGSPYIDRGAKFGIILYGYGKGITGEEKDSSVKIPADIVQDNWLDLYVSPEQAASLAGSDGVLYGLQYGVNVQAGHAYELFIGSAYSNPGYILISKVTLLQQGYYQEKTVTYKLYDDVEKQVSFTTNKPLNNYFVYPEREGYLFCGWYVNSGSEEVLFDFSSTATEDFTLTARWVKVVQNTAIYVGLYTDNENRITVFADGTIDVSSVLDYYDDIGIGEDGVLYATTADKLYSFNLAEMEKSEFNTVSYYSFGKLVKKVTVGKNETVNEFTISSEGFTFNGWKIGSVSGHDFTEGEALTQDVSLYASYTPIEAIQSKYESSLGVYYNPINGDKIELCQNKVARFFGQQEKQLSYYILENDRFAFNENGDFVVGNISPFVIEIDGQVFVKLTTFIVTFDIGDGTLYEVEVNSGDYKVQKPEDPTRKGLVFVRWETVDGKEYNFDNVVYKSITLYGKWAKDTSSSSATASNSNEKGGCSSSIAGGNLSLGLFSVIAVAYVAIKILRGKKDA